MRAPTLEVCTTAAPDAVSLSISSVVRRNGARWLDLEGLLEAVDGLGTVAEDAACVVGEHVDAGICGVQIGGERAHLIEPGEVGEIVVRADLAGDGLGLLRGAPDDDDTVTVPVELPGGRGADTVAGSGDDDDFALVHGLPLML
ncbi:hypothetical protein JOF55_001791 [Haloactinomyces albus]|uniref:Uncharacterized protein n=1 Tax=Haloactinomyces albus TaxID=1352928 RepID=A0AAE3ZD21_9ACTN|nr:hypothetical protein [Haloactinomyces albus]MDR7301610.1 hypothetical protein [Haloactinomyces albus]